MPFLVNFHSSSWPAPPSQGLRPRVTAEEHALSTPFEGLFSPSLLSNYSTCLFPPWHFNSVFSCALVSPGALEKTPVGAEQIGEPTVSPTSCTTGVGGPGVTPTEQRGGLERLSFIWPSESWLPVQHPFTM